MLGSYKTNDSYRAVGEDDLESRNVFVFLHKILVQSMNHIFAILVSVVPVIMKEPMFGGDQWKLHM